MQETPRSGQPTSFGLLSPRPEADAAQQKRHQLTLTPNSGFREDIPQMHARCSAPDSKLIAAFFQPRTFHQEIGYAGLGRSEAIKLTQFGLGGFHRQCRVLDQHKDGRLRLCGTSLFGSPQK